jgi:hypothetical protein
VKEIPIPLLEIGGLSDTIAVAQLKILIAAAALAALSFPLAAEGGAVPSQSATGSNVINSLPLHLELAGMKAAKAPEVREGRLVLSVSGPYRAVAAAFAHECFAILHPFDRNRQGVFVLAYPIPLKWKGNLEYRIVVDGVWTLDPCDPEMEIDPDTGLALSVAEVPYISDLKLGVYQVLGGEEGRTARFVFRAASGESVSVCGDFDNWDPFIHEMAETSPGLYELDLPLAPGRHYYTYIYRGEALPDPLNPDKSSNLDGKVVSVLTVR